MIHYHGGPVTPNEAAVALWTRRHALVSFERQDQTSLAYEVAQTVLKDCGAFSKWRGDGSDVDLDGYVDWCIEWQLHPADDGAIIPDKIDGNAFDNDRLIARWHQHPSRPRGGIPVWHMHEDVERLRYLMQCARGGVYRSVALGSSGQWDTPGTDAWWVRMSEAMDVVCDEEGRPLCKLHGLRMLSPTIFSHLPLASADSCNVARNIGLDKRWSGPYAPVTPQQRSLVLAERIELHAAAARWNRRRHGVQHNLELIG